MDQDSVSFDCAPNVIGKSKKKRKFFYQTFLSQVDKQLLQKIQAYLKKNQAKFQQQKQERLKIETEKPSIDEYKKRRPIIKFTLYQDLYLIRQCKRFQGVISKSSFFWYIALHLDRNVHYVQERIKKKLPNMTIKDLRFAIQHQVPLRFGFNRIFIPPKIKEAKLEKDSQSESYESDSEQSESHNRVKLQAKLIKRSFEQGNIPRTIQQEQQQYSQIVHEQEQTKIKSSLVSEISNSVNQDCKQCDHNQSLNQSPSFSGESQSQQSEKGKESELQQIEAVFSEQNEDEHCSQRQKTHNQVRQDICQTNKAQKSVRGRKERVEKDAFEDFKQKLKQIRFFYAETEASENEQGQKIKTKSLIVLDLTKLDILQYEKQPEPITQ